MTGPLLFALPVDGKLDGPPYTEKTGTAGTFPGGVRYVTGGGLVGAVDAERGLRGIWSDSVKPEAHLDVLVEGRRTSPAHDLRVGAGGWIRVIPLASGSRIREVGLFPDVVPAPVVTWSLEDGTVREVELIVRLGRGTDGPAQTLEVGLESGATAGVVCDLSRVGTSRSARATPDVRRLLAPLRARERQRRERWTTSDGARMTVEAIGAERVTQALRQIEDAPLSGPRQAEEPLGVVAGMSGGSPRFVRGSGLAEMGIGALCAGRWKLAGRMLEACADEPEIGPIAFLYLVSAHALWTGDPSELRRHSDAILDAASRTEPVARAAGFPSATGTLAELSRSLEPLGRVAWVDRIRTLAEAAGRPEGGGGLRLPMAPASGKTANTGSNSWSTPSPDDFADPATPGLGPRRTLHSARLVRAWVEKTLGVRPDGAFGRLHLAPEIAPAWNHLSVRGIRLADARIDIGYRRRGAEHTFSVLQTEGRVPINLVFEPVLPVSRVQSIHIGGEAADIGSVTRTTGIQIVCQFPLDARREIRVVAPLRSDPGPSTQLNG